jgi:N-acetylglutamate synthase-like GNAT family acetyltransferase
MSIVIERAQEEHRPAIMRLLEQANMHYIPSQEMPGLTYENYFVAMAEGQVVGFCGYKVLSATTAKTELMVVDKEHRGEGIGYALQVQRMEDMHQRGIRTLTTNTDLPATIQWYKKLFGYKEIGTLKKFHEFSDPSIDHWTTLQVDLGEWAATREQKG